MKSDFFFIGVSLANPIFTKQEFRNDLFTNMKKRGIEEYKINFFELPFVHTLESLGYSKEKSIKEAQKKLRYTKNKLLGGSIYNDIMIKDNLFINWDELYKNIDFQEKYKYLYELYNTNSDVKNILQEESKRVLLSLGKNYQKEGLVYDLNTASLYIIEELSFFYASSKIYNKGKSNLLYYKEWDLLDKIERYLPKNFTESFNLSII